MAKRVLAIVGAVAIVLAAMAIRAAWTDDDGGGRGDGATALSVVCDPDLAAACQQLGDDVRIEVRDSEDASRALLDGDLEDVDAWVTTSAWTELTAGRLTGGSDALGAAQRLATADVAVATIDTRAPVLVDHCGDTPMWRCLGDAAGQPWTALGGLDPWGDVRTGLPDADTATGLPVLAAVAVGYFDGPGFAANDFAGFDTWLARLADPSGSGDRDVLATLVRRRGTYDAGGVLRHAAAQRPEVEVLDALPAVSVDAVIAPLGGRSTGSLDDDLRAALVEQGWRAADGDPTPLLGGGVMGALHALWKDVTR